MARIILGNRRGSSANRQAHSSPSLRSGTGARRSIVRPHVERAADAHHDPSGRNGVGIARDPSFLLRCAEPHEDDRRRAGRDRSGEVRIVLGGVDHPVLRDRDTPARDRDPRSRERPHPVLGRALGDAVASADQGHRGAALRRDPHQELADLHAGPSPDAASRPEALDHRDARTVGESEIGGPQDRGVRRVGPRVQEDLGVRSEDPDRAIALEPAEAEVSESRLRCDVIEPHPEDARHHGTPVVVGSGRTSSHRRVQHSWRPIPRTVPCAG